MRSFAALGFAAILLARPRCLPPREPAVATFNVENFPQSERQIAGAFAEIREMGVAAVAMQEITDPDALRAAVRSELGPVWGVAISEGDDLQRLALIYDRQRFAPVSARTRDETRVKPRAKPILEVRLQSVASERIWRLLVVHLKAGGAEHAPTRAQQLAALGAVVAEGTAVGDRVVLLGDFNTTTTEDRDALRRLAVRTGLHWTSESLGCTSYWERTDGCRGSALDHVLTSDGGGSTAVGGACATEGCDPSDRCPLWRREISDHCPVVALP